MDQLIEKIDVPPPQIVHPSYSLCVVLSSYYFDHHTLSDLACFLKEIPARSEITNN